MLISNAIGAIERMFACAVRLVVFFAVGLSYLDDRPKSEDIDYFSAPPNIPCDVSALVSPRKPMSSK